MPINHSILGKLTGNSKLLLGSSLLIRLRPEAGLAPPIIIGAHAVDRRFFCDFCVHSFAYSALWISRTLKVHSTYPRAERHEYDAIGDFSEIAQIVFNRKSRKNNARKSRRINAQHLIPYTPIPLFLIPEIQEQPPTIG